MSDGVLAQSIVRKIIRGDPYGQAYFDVDAGVVDAWVDDFTDEEKAYLRRIQEAVYREEGRGISTEVGSGPAALDITTPSVTIAEPWSRP